MRVRAGTIAALCSLAVALSLATSARAADPFYGIFAPDMSNPPAKLAADMDAYARTGAGTLREHLFWDRIERAPGVFDFTDSDALIAAAGQRGMTILPVLVNTPAFYSTRPAGVTTDGWPPRDAPMITRFSQELARRYGRSGTYWGCLLPGWPCRRPYRPITAWEVWNEPDLTPWWRTGVDARKYTALLANAYNGLKAGDASAEVVLGGLSGGAFDAGGYLEKLYDGGAAAYFDTLGMHPYGGTVGSVVGLIRKARAIAVAKGDATVPIRATEYGFATGGVREWVTTAPCQAALVAATTRELSTRRAELGLKAISQFQWQDRATDPTSPWPNHAGLLYVDGSAKPALGAFTEAVASRPPPTGLTVPLACPSQFQG